MVETSRDWSEKLPFALWAYRTSFRTSIGATLFSLVYGMEVVLPIETEMGSLRIALEQILKGLVGDPRGKFRPSWSGPYVIRELTPEGAAWLINLDGNQFLEPTNVDHLKNSLMISDSSFCRASDQISILGHIPLSMMRLYSGQLGFRLSTSLELPTIDCIMTSLHGFVEIEMDHIGFHPRSMGGSFSQILISLSYPSSLRP
ncbi:hypothetical protein AAG906_001685 [Vitis piasezkii]